MSLRHTFAVTLFGAASLPLLALAEGSQPQNLGRIVLYGTSGNGAAIGTNTTDPIDEETISRLQASSLNDALSGNASVISSNRGNILRSLPNVRGFGASPHMANDPSVQVTLDGVSTDGNRVYQNSGAMIIDPSLLRSVQVLTGPLASLEYGSGVAGGTVAMETINGSDLTGDQQGFKFRQQLGANSNGQGWLTSSTLAWQPSDRVDFLFNFTRRGSDEQKDGAGKKLGLPGFNVPSYLLKARLRLDEANSVTFSYNKSETAERNVPYAQATAASVFGNVNRDTEGTIASVAYNYAPADSDLIDIELKYSKSQQDIKIQPLGGGAAASFAGRYEVETDTISLKNTARFQSGSIDHTLRAGIEWSSRERDTWNTAGQAGFGYNPAGKDQRLSLFAIDNMDFNNGWRASLAARVERQKINGSKNGGALNYGPFKNTAKTIGFGLERDLGAGVTAFGSIAKGESLATLDVFHYVSPTRGGKTYGDGVQKNTNLEIGARYAGSDLFTSGDSLSGSFSIYQTDIKDALFGPASGSTSEYTAYKMRGIELSARYEMASGFYAIGALSRADHKERYYDDGTGRGATAVANRWRDYLYNPGTQATVTLGHKWDNGWDVSWKVAGAKRVSVDQLTKVETKAGWAVNDLSVRYVPQSGALEGMTIDFAVENIFDKTYKQPMSYLNEPGRNVKLTLAKTF